MTYERGMDAACCMAIAAFLLVGLWMAGLAEVQP